MLSDYGRLRIEERNGILTATFKSKMKYGKLINNNLDIKEVEKGIEVGGTTTEQQLKEQGYKPVCEVEEPEGAEYFVYREYDTCFVQEWRMKDEPFQDGDIWTSDSGIDPTYDDLARLQRDTEFVTMNINSYSLTNKQSVSVRNMFPHWEDYIGKSLNEVGFKVLYKDDLYEILQPVPTVLEGQTPDIVPANYGLVSEHEGTKEDPIPYVHWLVIRKGKYYTENGILYIGLMDAPNGYDADLSTLVTLAKKVE